MSELARPLGQERNLYFFSGEINRDDIDASTGSHDELKDWAYPDDSELLLEVEPLISDVFRAMLGHVGHELGEPVDPEGQIVSETQLKALGELARGLRSDHTVAFLV